MKRSRKIALTLLASVSLMITGCDQEQEVKKEIYSSKEKCSEDWGSDKCQEDRTVNRWFGPAYYYYRGYPYYVGHNNTPRPLEANAKFSNVKEGALSHNSTGTIASRQIVRGGFGKSSSFHSSGS